MKKLYEAYQIEIVVFNNEEAIVASAVEEPTTTKKPVPSSVDNDETEIL